MGLRNSAQSFQRLLDSVLLGLDDCFVYLEDILIWSKNDDDHKKTLEKLFWRLNQNGLAISPKKCVFGVSLIDFLGYRKHSDTVNIRNVEFSPGITLACDTSMGTARPIVPAPLGTT